MAQVGVGDNCATCYTPKMCYILSMKKENATIKIRIKPSTHKKLKMLCAELDLTFSELIEKFSVVSADFFSDSENIRF